ncbi:MFS transporter [Winogradskya humida]|uniref:MFS transporter n=1 Tax=Winogradskya humida TaxID=113566 RepID=UPI0019458B0D|nr:MFS transporter [Actinoplanes humidus]
MRSSPYGPVLRDPRMRRLLPGFAASSLGDGMSAVAVSWLAIEIAPPDRHGMWVALAVAAYTLPGALGTFLLASVLRGRSGAQLVTWDSTLRAVALGAIAIVALSGALSIGVYVALLAVSSLLHSWGSAGTYTLMAELLPERDHVPANALLTTLSQGGVLIGPLLAAAVIAGTGASTVIALDAVSFAVLALFCGFGMPWAARADLRASGSGFRVMLADRKLVALLALTFCFFALYGPVEVGLPVYVSDYLHAPASHLAWYFTAFGGGAVIGGLIAGYLRAWPLWPTASGIVIGVGAAFLPLGLGAPVAVSVAGLAVAGIVYAPYGSITIVLFQRSADRAQVLAARRTVMILAGPVGVGTGGLLVTGLGPRPAMLVTAVGTMTLGILAAAATAVTFRQR